MINYALVLPLSKINILKFLKSTIEILYNHKSQDYSQIKSRTQIEIFAFLLVGIFVNCIYRVENNVICAPIFAKTHMDILS